MPSVHSLHRGLPFFTLALAVAVVLASGMGSSRFPADRSGSSTRLSQRFPSPALRGESGIASAGRPRLPIPSTSIAPIATTAVPVVAFDGLRFGGNGPYTDGYAPPDVQVAVGPNHILEMVNLLGRISTKAGTEVRTFPLSTFFRAPSTDLLSDPKVRFDVASGRWFASLSDITTSRILLEVSTSGDPTGSWTPFTVSTTAGCADQPLLGISNLLVVLSANDFTSCTVSNPTYLGVQYWVLNKADLVSGASARFMSFGPDPTLISVQPVHSLGPTDVQFMVTTGSGPTATLSLFSVAGVPPGVAVASRQDLAIRPTAVPPTAPQAGTKGNLDTADARVQDAMWAANRLWLTLDDGCTPPDDNRVRSCVRLIEVDTANSTVVQDFNVGLAGKYLFYPALRTDGEGHLVVVFGESSASEFPGIMVASRSDGDPPNTLGSPQSLRTGSGPEVVACASSVCRYGDYFGAAADSVDAGIIWIAGEYGTSSGWATFIAAVAESFRLTLSYSVTGGGSGYLPPTLTYVLGGRSASVALTTTPTAYPVDAGTPWSVNRLLGGSGGNERWVTNQVVTGNATSSVSLAFVYSHQYFASFGYRVTGGGTGYVAPAVSYEQFALPVSNVANVTDWVDAGSSYAFPPSLGGSNLTDRWQADPQSASGTVGAAGAIVVAYHHQAFVSFGVRGPPGSSVSPGSGWYDVGASLVPSATAGVGWVVGAWVGAGPGAYSGTSASPTILVLGPFSETAVLYPGLTIDAGLGGTVSYAYNGGAGTVPAGSSSTVFVPSGTNVSLVESPSSSFAFSGWSGAASGNQSSIRVTVTAPLQVTASFALTQVAAYALYSAFGAVIVIVALLVIALVRRKRRAPPPPPPSLPLPP